MKTKGVVLATITAFLTFLLVGCGISQAEYDRVSAQLTVSQSQVAELQEQINELKEKYELAGETPTETAQNIVKRYHETHVYSEYDFFVCSDMALDVWDMLKAQGINAIVKTGNVKTEAKDITDADHAWVLAETSPGKYLALETTGGYAVWGEDNLLYYRGWSFDNPREYKRFVELKYEYNIRVRLIEQAGRDLESARQKGLDAANQLSLIAKELEALSILDPLWSFKLGEAIPKIEEMGEYIGRMKQLNELTSQQKQELENIVSEMRGLIQ
jgi:outer membrane murein-binding lipoprotein Lpp